VPGQLAFSRKRNNHPGRFVPYAAGSPALRSVDVVRSREGPDSIITDIPQSFGHQAGRSSARILPGALELTDQEFDAPRILIWAENI
jgi:hypothetical protein